MVSNRALLFKSFVLFFLPLIVNSRDNRKILNEDTWGSMLRGEWMIEFFAPWCPACRQLEPIWKEFASWGPDLGIQVGAIDVTTNPGLSGRFAITALPTVFHVKDGVFRQYRGSKRKEELISFIEDAKWKDIEPIPSWKSPQSFQMSSLAYFFKLSMFLRTVHNEIVEFGIPYWGSYVIFGLVTILLGAMLGLLIVCIIDYLCPTKKPVQQQAEAAQKKSEARAAEQQRVNRANEAEEKADDAMECSSSQDESDVTAADERRYSESIEERMVRKRGPYVVNRDDLY